MIDTKAIREVAAVTSDSERMQFKPSTVIALLDRMEAAESQLKQEALARENVAAMRRELTKQLKAAEAEVLEQARLLGIGGEKELALMAKLEAAEKDAARYRWLRDTGDETWVPLKSRLRGSNKAESHIDAAIAAAMKEQK